MRITGRRGAIAFFITLGVCLTALAGALNVGWIILSRREAVLLVLGIIFFFTIMAGLVLNTIFLIREIRRNEQHDSFMNAVTHELKTPIASLRLYLETLQNRPLTPEQQHECLQDMMEDVDRLLSTVGQVLKAAEVRGRSQRQPAEVNVAELAQECTELARSRHHLTAEALRFNSEVNGTAPVVLGEADDLRTAFNNVIDNAVKYSGSDVAVEVDVRVPDSRHVLLQVRDHGIGIPRGELKQVFKRFYRVKSRAVSGVKGSGLGLFIVRTIARRHHGDVEAHSEGEGRGSTVSITLPRAPRN
jgi:two-component system sensor histidine kinase SenX3